MVIRVCNLDDFSSGFKSVNIMIGNSTGADMCGPCSV